MRLKLKPILRYCICALLLCPLSLSAPAGAQDIASAEVLFKSGVEDMDAGRYEKGCRAIAESLRLDPRPGTLFTLATCERQWGHIATAFARYGDYISVYEKLPENKKAEPVQAARYKEAGKMRATLGPDVPKLTLVLPNDAPAGVVVKRDGQELTAAALGVELPIDPGDYVLTLEAPGRDKTEQRVTIGKGEKKTVALVIPAGPALSAATPSASAGAPRSGLRTAAYVIGGVGVAGLAAGGVLGGLALSRKGDINDHCGAAIGQKDEAACDPTGLDAADGAKTLGTASTAAFAAGGAAIGAAVVLFFLAPKSDRPPSDQAGRSLSIGFAPVGMSGVMFGARGRW